MTDNYEAEDLSEVMDTGFGDVPEAQDCPEGDYIFVVKNVRVGAVPNEKATPYADLTMVPIHSNDDHDIANLRPVYGRLWLSANAKKMTGEIIRDSIGVALNHEDGAQKTKREIFDEVIGHEVRARVRHRFIEGREKPIVEIARFLPPRKG